MGKQNLIKIERKTSENCTSDSFQVLQFRLGQFPGIAGNAKNHENNRKFYKSH